jgi:hypothetical protein
LKPTGAKYGWRILRHCGRSLPPLCDLITDRD